MLPWVCSVIDHRRRQNVVRTSVTHSAIASCATFLFLPHFDVICDLLLNRRTATWNQFVKWSSLMESQLDKLGRNLKIDEYWTSTTIYRPSRRNQSELYLPEVHGKLTRLSLLSSRTQ